MSKRTVKNDTGLSKQASLFDTGVSEGQLDILLGVKQLMSRQISASGMDRYDIAAQISRLTRRDCTKDMLDKYTSSNLEYEPGILRFAAFCVATHSLEPINYVLEPVGSAVINPSDRDLLRLAQLAEQKRTIELEMQSIQAKRGIR
ncbi:MAG: hypothetical protein OEL57_02215 [Trichlorobacter sp.]|uniref:hypothetical protein n=1 Tax=Trichlorobacter sp. TaxID=2911007 RepID=UPI002567F8B1|nr:hypothetical protein [Trichlorobacter sp.]MDK9716705.1 hypothetical protein [Trichlorobacter sp.]